MANHINSGWFINHSWINSISFFLPLYFQYDGGFNGVSKTL